MKTRKRIKKKIIYGWVGQSDKLELFCWSDISVGNSVLSASNHYIFKSKHFKDRFGWGGDTPPKRIKITIEELI